MKRILLTLSIVFVAIHIVCGQRIVNPRAEQERLATVESKLSNLVAIDSTYITEVDISVGKMPLSELMRNVAKAAEVNLSVKGAENIQVTCNFSRAKITDLIYFLCKEYTLEIDVVGNIVSIYPMPLVPEAKVLGISYKIADNSLSFDLSGDRLSDVTKRITELTGTNFFFVQALSEQKLSGYIRDMPFGAAIRSIVAMNGLEAESNRNQEWTIYAVEPSNQQNGEKGATTPPVYQRRTPFSATELSIDSLGRVTAQIGRGNVQDIITDLCVQQSLNYYFLSSVTAQTSIYVRDVDFETLLDILLRGSDFSYYYEDGIYIFGADSEQSSLVAVEKIVMHNRSVNKISEIIPDAIKNGIQVKEFSDLNSVIVSGERGQVARVRSFLRSIDKRVPLITIEIMIVDATKHRIMDIGVDAGFGKSDMTSGGTLTGIDVTLNAGSINKLINTFNGFGSVNMGKVGEGFYLGLQFLEDNGLVEMRSTPKLSTLNGHEATLKSGETKYYKEVSNNYYGSQVPVSYESYTWKSIDANLNIKIIPYVSEDEHITLDIEIDQTEFTTREEPEAPPGTATRSFSSQIRVQNEEMVLLGGMDQNVREKSNRGLPWIARVPVLKWFFGKTKDNKSEHKLNVFIKPTIVK
jgi:type IV pilus assembly protein PilQ